MPFLQIRRMVLVPLLGLVLLAGCDSGPSTTTTTAPTGHDGKTGNGPAASPAPAAK